MLVGWTAAALFQKPRILPAEPREEETARCVLALRGWRSPSMAYSVGFQYELLKRLEQETPWEFDFSLIGHDEIPDSLGEDLLVVPFSDSLVVHPAFFVSPVLPDSTVWIIPNTRETLIRTVQAWTGSFFSGKEAVGIRERFTPSYEPYRRLEKAPVSRIGPYDALLKKYAARIGWDWRLLGALAWKESKFHIEVRSAAGAEGLMQMMPHTARRHRTENMLDPEDNLRAATEYIARLQRLFADHAADPEELTRFTLAAYNAGEGRVLELIRRAESLGRPHRRWADLETLLPAVREDPASPGTDEGTDDGSSMTGEGMSDGFQGHETVRFMADVEGLHALFRILVP